MTGGVFGGKNICALKEPYGLVGFIFSFSFFFFSSFLLLSSSLFFSLFEAFQSVSDSRVCRVPSDDSVTRYSYYLLYGGGLKRQSNNHFFYHGQKRAQREIMDWGLTAILAFLLAIEWNTGKKK